MTLAAAALVAASLASCSPNKNNAATRKYQAFITRYNVHFNGQEHMTETLRDMESKYEDDFSRRLYMHPVEARQDKGANQPAGNFDRSIEKAQKAIQLRSIKKKPPKKSGQRGNAAYQSWMRREEYNPFLHNSWLLLGEGQFYNGDFLGAASTYFYISRHFWWLPETVTEAKLMQALSYVIMGWQYEAEMILTRIKDEDLSNSRLRELYNFVYADFYLHADDYEQALPYLEKSVRAASGAQKTRLNFLLGQVYARLDRPDDAYCAYGAAGSSSSTSYRTKFNARIHQSEVYTGTNIEPEVKALRRMTRYDRNKEYQDQIYYAIGNLYLSRRDTAHAIENYILANENSTRNGIDKAINQITLGKLYFEQRRYDLAQPCFSEAVPQLPETYPDYKLLKRRSDVLDELAVYSGNVTLQDSLLRLAAMSPEERMAVIERIIEDLKKKEREEAEQRAQEEYLAEQEAKGQSLQDNNTQSFTINADNSWYFYNTATRNAGKTDFQRRWGSRKLEDNWRRRNKATFSADDFEEANANSDVEEGETAENQEESVEQTQEEKDSLARAADPHFPEYYLAQIPMTEADKQTSGEVIQEGLYNMGVILKDKLEDFAASRAQFDRLLNDYPDNVYRLDTYNNLYLMLMRQGLTSQADVFRNLILRDFPDSPYGQAMRDPNYLEKLRGADQRAESLYEQTYEAYLANNNSAVHAAYETMQRDMPLSKIMPKFMFLHALAYVTENKPAEFNAVLRELLEKYPDTDITPIASEWLKGMARGRQLHAPQSNVRGMVWETRLSNDSTALADGAASFELNPESQQLLVFTYPMDEVNTNQLLYDIARFNFRSFFVRDFELETMNFGRLGLLVVHGFNSLDELNRYRAVMAAAEDLRLPSQLRPVAISVADFQTLLSQGRSFEEYFRYREEQDYIDAQEGILDSIMIQTLPEAETEAATGEAPAAVDGSPAAEAPAAPVAPVGEAPAAPATPAAPEGSPALVPSEAPEAENLAPAPAVGQSSPAAPAAPQTPAPEASAPAPVGEAPAGEAPAEEARAEEAPAQGVPVYLSEPGASAPQPVAQPQLPSAPGQPSPSAPAPSVPAPSAQQQPAPAPELPVGSEGDDPLLDE